MSSSFPIPDYPNAEQKGSLPTKDSFFTAPQNGYFLISGFYGAGGTCTLQVYVNNLNVFYEQAAQNIRRCFMVPLRRNDILYFVATNLSYSGGGGIYFIPSL